MFRKATRHGNLEVVKWLGDNNIVWDLNPSTTQKWDQNQICTPVGWTLCADAAWGGHAEALSYLSGKWCCPRAAAGGHLETLIWLRANGCPWELDPGYEITKDQILFTADMPPNTATRRFCSGCKPTDMGGAIGLARTQQKVSS